MAIRRMFNFVRNKNAFLLHSIVIAVLIGVSVWDSVGIIQTFVNDNQTTVVRTGVANESAIFLENLVINLNYYDSVLPKSWFEHSNRSSVQQSVDNRSMVETSMFAALNNDSINVSSSIEQLIATASLLTSLSELDMAGFRCLLDGRESCIVDAYVQNYSNILLNKPELEHLEETLLTNLANSLHSGPSNETDGNMLFTIHGIWRHSMLMVELDPARMARHDDFFQCQIRLIDDPPDFQSSSFYSGMDIYHKGTMISMLQFEPKYSYDIFMTVKNNGIYDKHLTTDCTWEPQVGSNNLGSFYNTRDYLRMVAQRCACIPFTEKMNFRKFNDSSWTSLPYCDFRKYYECSEESTPVKFDQNEWLPSCVIVRNEYDVSVTQNVCDQEICPYINFMLLFTDHTYVIYEDRFQLTTAQFISQIGGDIGLYTGLSLLSLWQLIVFVHARYRGYKLRYFSTNPDGRKNLVYYKRFLGELCKEMETFTTHFGQKKEMFDGRANEEAEIDVIAGSTFHSKQGTASGCRTTPAEDRLQVMENKIDKLERTTAENNRMMEARFARLESKLSELVSVISKPSNRKMLNIELSNVRDIAIAEL